MITVNIKGQPIELLTPDMLLTFHNKTTKVDTWILDTFFPNRRVFEGETIPMGDLDTSTPIAPLVAPSVQGRVLLNKAEYNVTHVKPAYLKPSGYITPKNASDLALLGQMRESGVVTSQAETTLTDKMRIAQIGLFARNRESISNFNVLMALEVLLTGKVVLKSPDFPEVTVDYGRNAALDFTPGTKWGAKTAKVVTDIRAMNGLLSTHGDTDGAVILTTAKVFGAMVASDEFQAEFVAAKGANAANPLNVGDLGGGNRTAKYRGELDGVAVWTLDATYKDADGNKQRYIGDKSFYLIADMDGFLCNCEIQHLDAMNTLVDVFDYVVPNADPSGVKLISESSPLAVPSMVNGVVGGDAFLA